MPVDPKAQRLAEALRANLRRRKAQARAAEAPAAADPPRSGGEADREPGGGVA